jgi:adenine phosphoribosyltransferase
MHDVIRYSRHLSAGTAAYLASRVRRADDFPREGIVFRDVSPLLASPAAFGETVSALSGTFCENPPDVIVGVEARGFIFGAALALATERPFVPARKPGKLPGSVDSVAYKLEYGEARLEIQVGAIPAGAYVLIVDDLLATGGTARAAAQLVAVQRGRVTGFAFVAEIAGLPGREVLRPFGEVHALLTY